MMDRSAVAAPPALSVTWTVKVEVPSVVGVPEITPEESSDSPSGKVPDAMDQV